MTLAKLKQPPGIHWMLPGPSATVYYSTSSSFLDCARSIVILSPHLPGDLLSSSLLSSPLLSSPLLSSLIFQLLHPLTKAIDQTRNKSESKCRLRTAPSVTHDAFGPTYPFQSALLCPTGRLFIVKTTESAVVTGPRGAEQTCQVDLRARPPTPIGLWPHQPHL